MPSQPQSFANHTRLVPMYHGFVFPVLVINFLWQAWELRQPSIGGAVALLTATALIVLALFARIFALKAQDRVIRLEMRLRMLRLLPEGMRERIDDFSLSQLIALRFASDAELPELCGAVLRDNLQDKTAIKKMIKNWTADETRV